MIWRTKKRKRLRTLQKRHHRWPSMWPHGWWLKEVWRKWALCKLLSVCVWVRGRVAGTIQLPAGQCPVTDPSVSTLIRQRQATASWTPCAPIHIQTHSNGSKVDFFSYTSTLIQIHLKTHLFLYILAFCPHWDCVFVLQKQLFKGALSTG